MENTRIRSMMTEKYFVEFQKAEGSTRYSAVLVDRNSVTALHELVTDASVADSRAKVVIHYGGSSVTVLGTLNQIANALGICIAGKAVAA